MLVTVCVTLVPICFIAYQHFSWTDYAYVLAPALRLSQGAGLSEIYFQYDLLVSLVAKCWMDLGIDPGKFYIAGQLSYYIFLIAAFLFARAFFSDGTLPLFLLVSLVDQLVSNAG